MCMQSVRVYAICVCLARVRGCVCNSVFTLASICVHVCTQMGVYVHSMCVHLPRMLCEGPPCLFPRDGGNFILY
jgi:hypothetical protein